MLCLFLNWHLQWGQFPSSPLLCQESFCFTNIRSARYVDNTGTENQCQYEFSHFPVTVPTYNGSPLILILYDLSFRFTQNGIICRLPVFRLLSDENIMELKEICHSRNPPTWYLLTSKAGRRLSNIRSAEYIENTGNENQCK